MAQPKILLTRIDDRFIYGQDVALWNEAVGSNLVLVVNDEIAADARKWAPMRVAAPEGVAFTKAEIINTVHFQEQYFKSEIGYKYKRMCDLMY